MKSFIIFILAISFQKSFFCEARYLLIDIDTEDTKTYPEISSNVFRSGKNFEKVKGILTKI